MEKIEVEYTKFVGGLDQANPTFSIKPGYLLDCLNYEPGIFGGYRRIDGFERFDGRTKPSSASYWMTPCTITGAIAVGNTVTGATSGASGNVLQVNASELILGRVSGTFGASEALNVGGTPQATTTGLTLLNAAGSNLLHATYRQLAADDLRTDITAVPGSGKILGTVMYNDVLYAWRNNAGGTAAVMHKSTASGWSAITLPFEIKFNTGLVLPAEGATITGGTSTATAIVRRVVVRTGVWGSTATGSMFVDTITGTWQSGELIKVGAVTQATSTSLCTQITLTASGRYEFEIASFYGQQDKTRLYGVNGKNRAFEFDGTYYIPLSTGMTVDTPEHVCIHKKHLFLSFKSSAQHSGIGDPYSWSVVAGAAELAVGENITAFQRQPGDVLAIYTRNATHQLLGSSSANWDLKMLTPETGAIEHTTQSIGFAYSLDDRGIIRISQSLNYGNFDHATMSRMVQPTINAIRPVAVASTVYRSRNQYRIYGSDGRGVIMSVEGDKVTGFTKFEYPVNVSCVWSGEDGTGVERVFFGADNGFVYEANKGSSFDDAKIDAFVLMPYNTARSPRYRKRYRKIVLEMQSDEYSEISFNPEFSFGDADVAAHSTLTAATQGLGGAWDVATWDTFAYDSKATNTPEFSIAGTGTSLSILFYSRSAIDAGHSLDGAMVHYTVRRISR